MALILLFSAWSVVQAQGPNMSDSFERERAAIRTVIQRQIQAFREDDADLAFSFASPGIQDQFGTAQNFLQMVKATYPVVYRPRSVILDRISFDQSNPLQEVLFMDQKDQLYRAVYILEQQPNNSWRIAGCYLVQQDGNTI